MIVTQQDIAHLGDDDLRRLVLALSTELDGPLPDFWRRLAVGVVGAFRERRRALWTLEDQLLNGDEEVGELLPLGTDPVVHALEELRRGASGGLA